MTKAQSATEFLMTYGWAMLIVIIMAAALYALGIFNPDTYREYEPSEECKELAERLGGMAIKGWGLGVNECRIEFADCHIINETRICYPDSYHYQHWEIRDE